MNVLLDAEGLACGLKHDADINVESRGVGSQGRIVGVLNIAPCPFPVRRVNSVGHIGRIKVFDAVEAALGIDLGLRCAVTVGDIQAGDSGKTRHLGIVGAEGRSDMDNARTVFGSDIISEDHAESTLVGTEPRDELLITHALQLAALESAREHLVRHFVVEPGAYKSLGEDVCSRSACVRIGAAHFDVVDVRPDAQCGIGRKGPGGCGPRQEVKILLPYYLELGAASGIFNITVAAGLIELVGAEAGACSGAVRLNGFALVKQALAVNVLKEPPESLDIAVVVGDVRVVHIDPVTYALGEVAPLGGVFHDLTAAGGIVVRHAYLAAYIFFGDAKFLFNSQLDGQAVGIPAGPAAHFETALGLVTAHGVLDAAGHHVMDTGHTVGTGRAFEEYEFRRTFTQVQRFLERTPLLPPLQYLVSGGYKVKAFIFFECHIF